MSSTPTPEPLPPNAGPSVPTPAAPPAGMAKVNASAIAETPSESAAVPPGTPVVLEVPDGYELVDDTPQPATVWSQPKVATGVGVGASIVIHLSLVLLGVLLLPQFREIVAGKKVAEQTIVPIAELATDQVGGIPNPGMTDQNRPAGQNLDNSVAQSDAWAEQRSATLDKQLTGGSGEAPPTQIGIGGNRSAGSGLGNGVAGGGGLAKFGVPGGGSGIGPRGAVFGNGGNAYRIVFVCDGTGDMVSSVAYPVLLRELETTVSKLKPKQSFNVVFFYNDTAYAAVDKNQLLPAIPANTDKLKTFLKNFSGGLGTDPRPAITFAFNLKPDLIYFLSNGDFDKLATYDQVKATFKTLNRGNATRVNTVLLTSMPEQNNQNIKESLRDASACMEDIAKEHGGKFTAIDARKVYLNAP